jgi:cytochrome b561
MIQVVLRLIDVHTAAATVQHFAPRYGVLHRM